MDKELVFEKLTVLSEAQAVVARLREEARGVIYDLMKAKKEIVFPESLISDPSDDGVIDALESHSESAVYHPDGGVTAPEVGLIQSVVWDEGQYVAVVKGIKIGPDENGAAPRFECPLSDVDDVDAVLKFIMKYAE